MPAKNDLKLTQLTNNWSQFFQQFLKSQVSISTVNVKSRTKQKMAGKEAGNSKLVFFVALITFLSSVCAIIFPILVLTVLRDGSSSDICDILRQSVKNESLGNCPDCPASDCPKPKPSTFDPREVYERLDALDSMYNHWPGCQCIGSPGKMSPDGFGNCNIGLLNPKQAKESSRPWCYISQHGKLRVCPDQTPSESYPGFYWSRFACITP